MPATKFTDAELEALQGLRNDAQIIYMRGIRPYMDYQTGVAGIRRKLSEGSFREICSVDAHQGVQAKPLSQRQIRNCVAGLVRRGLVRDMGNFVFECILADRVIPSEKNQTPTRRESRRESSHEFTQKTQELNQQSRRESRRDDPPQLDAHQDQVNITNPPTLTRARVFLTRGAGSTVTVLPYDSGEIVITDADTAEAAAIYTGIPDLPAKLLELGSVLMGGGKSGPYQFENGDEAKRWLHARLREDNTSGGLPKATKLNFRGNHAATANTGSRPQRIQESARSHSDKIVEASDRVLAKMLARMRAGKESQH